MRGQPVATIEAMKMETAIAPVAGTVQRLAVGGGQQVEGGDLLVVLRQQIANRGPDRILRSSAR
jgi:biotin carboxyl carrier protein